MEELYQQIIECYKETGSVKKTAEKLGTYPIKVRRVLITEGLWHSKTSDRIAELMGQGLSVTQIAETLLVSEKNVQSYMPYVRGQYGGKERSNEAIRSEEYRERMQTAAKNQVIRTEAKSRKNQEKQENEREKELEEQRRLMEELQMEKERLRDEKNAFWDRIEAEMKRVPVALQLHLELDLGYFDEEHREVLRKYGRMKESLSREVIVPGNMTLHGLHYAIMKAFGWQNSHLHCYVPYEEEYQKMTDGGQVKEWTRQVGMYFRFPGEDYEDIYWDDDYEEEMSFKSWLKSKYCGPYSYGGIREHYLPAQLEVDRFRKKWPKIQKLTTDQRTWEVYFEGQCEELLERLMIWTVLKTPADQGDWETWREEKERILKKTEADRNAAIRKYVKLDREMENIAARAGKYFTEDGTFTDGAVPLIREMEEKDREIGFLLFEHDPEPVPALSALCYQYDYGDGWEIKITCTNAWYDKSVYVRDEEGNICHDKNGFIPEKSLFVDAFGQEIEGEFLDHIIEIARKEKPVCIAWDGISLVDDVGGVGGFCEFLEIINGNDSKRKKEYKEWAKGLGWTGRMPKPENIL